MKVLRLSIIAALAVLIGTWLFHLRTHPFDLHGPGGLVLVYHRVLARRSAFDLPGSLDDYTIYADDFQHQLRYLKNQGVRFIKPDDLESVVRRQAKPDAKFALVTLDDGDISQYRNAFPILKNERIPFTVFVISGQVGSRNFNGMEMATWSDIREMVASGLVTIGSHTHNLHALDSSGKPAFQGAANLDRFEQDLRFSTATIQRELGATPRYFAYPYGFGTPETDRAALHLGMRLLFSLRPGLVRPGDPAFFVKRIMVNSRNWNPIERWVACKPCA